MTEDKDGDPVPGPLEQTRDDVVVLVSPRDRECVLAAVKQRVPLLLDPPPAAVVVDLSGMTRLTTTLSRTGLSRSLALGGVGR